MRNAQVQTRAISVRETNGGEGEIVGDGTQPLEKRRMAKYVTKAVSLSSGRHYTLECSLWKGGQCRSEIYSTGKLDNKGIVALKSDSLSNPTIPEKTSMKEDLFR